MDAPVRRAAALLPLLILLNAALAIEEPCSACAAVAAELQRRLDAETPRNHLDMRHRVDQHGKRYGKILDYRLSELRAVELLEDLCDSMHNYLLLLPAPAPAPPAGPEGGAEGAASGQGPPAATDGEDDDEGGSQESGQAAQGRAWMRYKGAGAAVVEAGRRPPTEETDVRAKQLAAWCGVLLEEHEDQVLAALQGTGEGGGGGGGFEGGVAATLCTRISRKCAPGELAQEAAEGGQDRGGSSEAGAPEPQQEL